MSLIWKIAGAVRVANQLASMGKQIEAEVPKVGKTIAEQARDDIRRLAPKDRPYYFTTIDIEVLRHAGGVYECRIGTAEPYGRRLEHGYWGPDALGRTFNQDRLPAQMSSVVGMLTRGILF